MWYTCYSLAAVLLHLIEVINANPTLATSSPRARGSGVQFNILHTCDMHVRLEQAAKQSSTCSKSEAASNKCYGGFARIATLVRNARAGSIPALYLDAGGNYQGSVWFTVYKWRIVAKFLNILQPDAIALGNHEFDLGVGGLLPFLNNVTFPVLATNLYFPNESGFEGTKLAKSTVIDINGTQVGIIGYLSPQTKFSSRARNMSIQDEVGAVTEEARRLKESGVNILIALGHSGTEIEKSIAMKVDDIDLVIGGRTEILPHDHPYPMAITQSSGRIVYVVRTVLRLTRSLGNLSLTFDSQGELTHIEGNHVLVDYRIEQAADVLAELENWRNEITNLTSTIVGSTSVFLDGEVESCRLEECNLGNLIADALVDYNARQYAGSDGWTDAAIGVMSSGAMRISITTSNNNQITMADILTLLPFENTALVVSMTGERMLLMLEWGARYLTGKNTDHMSGAFLQFSGIKVTYDRSRPPNSKVVSVQVRCANCTVPEFHDLDETATYSVIINDFMYAGGSQFTMLPGLNYTTLDLTIADIVIDYLGRHSPVHPMVEGRITFADAADAGSVTH